MRTLSALLIALGLLMLFVKVASTQLGGGILLFLGVVCAIWAYGGVFRPRPVRADAGEKPASGEPATAAPPDEAPAHRRAPGTVQAFDRERERLRQEVEERAAALATPPALPVAPVAGPPPSAPAAATRPDWPVIPDGVLADPFPDGEFVSVQLVSAGDAPVERNWSPVNERELDEAFRQLQDVVAATDAEQVDEAEDADEEDEKPVRMWIPSGEQIGESAEIVLAVPSRLKPSRADFLDLIAERLQSVVDADPRRARNVLSGMPATDSIISVSEVRHWGYAIAYSDYFAILAHRIDWSLPGRFEEVDSTGVLSCLLEVL